MWEKDSDGRNARIQKVYCRSLNQIRAMQSNFSALGPVIPFRPVAQLVVASAHNTVPRVVVTPAAIWGFNAGLEAYLVGLLEDENLTRFMRGVSKCCRAMFSWRSGSEASGPHVPSHTRILLCAVYSLDAACVDHCGAHCAIVVHRGR